MALSIIERLKNSLQSLKEQQQYRDLPSLNHQGRHVLYQGKALVNIASNDYLGLGSNTCLLYTSPSPRD